MALIINQSFFIRDVIIPNVNNINTNERLISFVQQYEPQCLLQILGYPLYKPFGVESSQRMTDLLNGVEYTDSEGQLSFWQGLVHDTNISLIANYIYFNISRANATQTTGLSTAIMSTEAGTSTSPEDKMVDAWNFFSSEVYDMTKFLRSKKTTYPEFSNDQYYTTRHFANPINLFF